MDADDRFHVTFVCTGNICRSPMAEKIFAEHLRREGLDERVRVSSAGTHGWHVGSEADPRTDAVLQRHGYPTGHCAAKLGAEHLAADLVVAMTTTHERTLAQLGVPSDRRVLLRSFDPDADDDSVPDPYYDSLDEFEQVREQIEAAVPGLLERVRQQ
ncbi:low molecular weight protein-tyrosine-phosphatase [Rhodococcus pyridinivorans]|uniref:protein-tyrosine-phosphatase n=1 Tax=Rhodococcus pyridinivorans TaxID=103816 RepID=A0A7M2XHG4_9NOCA|nr:low molecular weight protein-tyrosine-phosphatase [Rhodococcus pyridinivorans]QOV97137.1 low molecular weight phosphotyrosine protein phosphatase [Rhodococcus pyridinivorans]WMM71114.1 low molecular weight protein-tyrosine-phosphatase [Rhodococcus pyridinivorans]